MKEFEEFITYKALGFKHGSTSAIDLDEMLKENGSIEIRNVCTKMSKELSDRLNNTVNLLDMRKRKFVEMAIIRALDDADVLIHEHLDDEFEQMAAEAKEAKK